MHLDAPRGDAGGFAQCAQRGARRAGGQPAPAGVNDGDRAGGEEQNGQAVRPRDRQRETRDAGDQGVAGRVVARGVGAGDVRTVHLASGGEPVG